jgi:carbon-monoxide dehydrogenase medium subunit
VVWLPDSIEEAWEIKQEFGIDSCFVAGGTLLQVHWRKGKPCPAHLISLERMKEIQESGRVLDGERTVMCFGALSTIDWLKHNPEILNNAPLLSEAVRNIAAPAIRSRATIGGNIVNGYGDAIPALLALDAIVTYFDGKNRKTELLWNYLQKKHTMQNSILISVGIPEMMETPKTVSFFQKIGRREAFSPSVVTISGYCCLNDRKEMIHIRLAAGSADTLPLRLMSCENLLKGLVSTKCDWKNVHQAITEEFTPCSDAFSSAYYKRMAAANVIVSELSRFIE